MSSASTEEVPYLYWSLGIWAAFLVAAVLAFLLPLVVAVYVVVASNPAGAVGTNAAVAVAAWIVSVAVAVVAYHLLQKTFLGLVLVSRYGDRPGLPPRPE